MASTVKKLDVLFVAADLLGPDEDAVNVSPEYEKAVVDMVHGLLGGNLEDREATAIMLRAIAGE